MAESPCRLDVSELAAVGTDTADPELRALEVAIYLEEALDVVLPDDILDAEHLGSPEAATVSLRTAGEL